MNNESGSVLQKASFALLLFIAAGLGYLIIRDRFPRGQAAVESIPSSAASGARTSSNTSSDPTEPRSSFAPLRPRNATNPPRTWNSNAPVLTRSSVPPASRSAPVVDSETTVTARPQNSLAVPVATTSGLAGGDASGSVVGRVTLRGTPPPEKAVKLDALCGRLHPAPMSTRHFVLGRDAGLGNVFVYVKSGAPKDETQQLSVPVLDNVACEFQPYVLGVRARQPFTLRNSDAVLHNMHIIPGRTSNREVNIGMPVKGMSVTKVYDQEEIFIKVKCDVHPWMFAYLCVMEHRWFAVTDGDGNFSLPSGLPPGRYTIAAIHLKVGEQTQPITIGDAGPEMLNFALEVPELAASAP
jgi:hypothetical protein